MAQKTGAIVTIGVEVWAEYTCSACGKENRLPDTARVTGSTASILALKKAGKGRDILPLLPGGVRSAGLSCCCGCGHREPWAELESPGLDKLQKIFLWVLAALAAAAYLLHTGERTLTALLLIGMGLAAVALGTVTLVKALRRGKGEKALAELPAEALPRLYLR